MSNILIFTALAERQRADAEAIKAHDAETRAQQDAATLNRLMASVLTQVQQVMGQMHYSNDAMHDALHANIVMGFLQAGTMRLLSRDERDAVNHQQIF
jgi:hypothetical protein